MVSKHLFNRLMCGACPDELVARNRTLPVLADSSQDFLAGGSEGDRGALTGPRVWRLLHAQMRADTCTERLRSKIRGPALR